MHLLAQHIRIQKNNSVGENKASINISFGKTVASQSSKQTTVVVFQNQCKKLPSSLDSEIARKESVK